VRPKEHIGAILSVPQGAEFRIKPSRQVNHDGTKVVDVREGRARDQEVAEPGEEPGRIVVGEKVGGIEAERAGAGERRLVHQGAGGIVRPPRAAVGAVGIAGKRRDAGRAVEGKRQPQRVLLVGTSATFPVQRDGQLPAGQDDGAASPRVKVARAPRVGDRDVARLAFDAVAEEDAFIARRLDGLLGGAERIGRPGDKVEGRVGKRGIVGLSAIRLPDRRARL